MSRLSVADWENGKTRLLSRQCASCIYRRGNLMRLAPGRLADITAKARRDESFVICHDTLPAMAPAGVKPAVCRGFYDRYSTQALQVIERLFGFLIVDPPEVDHGDGD